MSRLLLILFSCALMACSKPSLNEAWADLIATEGCLVGGQDAIDGKMEGSCFANEGWSAFLDHPTEEKLRFLTGRLSSTKTTSIHTCPLDVATEGELAVYALQHLTKRLWTDYSGSDADLLATIAAYKEALASGDTVFDQRVLWTILESAKQREALAAYFMESSEE